MKTELNSYFDSAKRNCMLCHTYRNFRPSEEQKQMAQTSTKKAYELLRTAFDELRAEDASVEKLEKVRAGKVLCLDASEACECCDKQRPRIKEIHVDIK